MKNDIRTSRKVGPLNNNQSTTNYGTRSARFRKSSSFNPGIQENTKKTSIHTSKTNNSSTVDRPIKSDRNEMVENPATIVGKDTEACVLFNDDDKNVSIDHKRRRPSTQSYINKRFLYDVTEPTSRPRNEGNLQSRTLSTAELMAASSVNLLRRNRSRPVRGIFAATVADDPSKLRSRRGRPLKCRLNMDSVKDIADDLIYRSRSRGRKNIKKISHKTADARVPNVQVNWAAHDLFDESATHGIPDYQLSDTQPITSLQKYPDTGDITAYSDVLLNAFDDTHSPGQTLMAEEEVDTVLRMRGVSAAPRGSPGGPGDAAYRPSDLDLIMRSRLPTGTRRHLDSTGDTYLSHGQVIYPQPRHRNSPTVNHPSTDILTSLYSDVHPSCFSSQPNHVDGGPDDADDELDDVLSPPDYLASSRRLHHRYPISSGLPHASVTHDVDELAGTPSVLEELEEEEEDLLSPELSIMAGSSVAVSSVVGASSGILERSDCEGGSTAMFMPQGAGNSAASSSRRKSPVRPMRVIRTKSHTAPGTTLTSSQQSPPLAGGGGHLENSSLILTSSLLHGSSSVYSRRRLSGENDYLCTGDSSRDLDLHQQEMTSRGGGSGASVIRLHSGQPPVLQTFPPSGRQLLASSGRVRGTASSPEASSPAATDDCGLIISVATSTAAARPTSSYLPGGPHSSRMLLSSGVYRPPTASNSTVSTLNSSSASSSSTSVNRTNLLSASPSASSLAAAAARRRPTILKRGGPSVASGGSGLLWSTTVPDGMDLSTAHQAPAATSDLHQPPSTGTSAVSALTISSVASTAAPTKLLQLVTAPLPSSPLPTSVSVSATSTSASMTASDRLFGRRMPPLSGHNKSAISLSCGGMPSPDLLIDACRAPSTGGSNTFGSNTPYRYAVVRDSGDGKRYLFFGSRGVFDHNSTSTTEASSPPTSGNLLANANGTTTLGQQIIPLDSLPMLPSNSGHLMDQRVHQVSAATPTLIRRSKGPHSANLVVTALPAAVGASDSVVVT